MGSSLVLHFFIRVYHRLVNCLGIDLNVVMEGSSESMQFNLNTGGLTGSTVPQLSILSSRRTIAGLPCRCPFMMCWLLCTVKAMVQFSMH